MTIEVIENTKAFVRKHLGTEGTGHDFWHASRVRNTATAIQAVEGGDPLIVELAAWLHDVGDRKVLNQPDDDPTVAANFLRTQKISPAIIDAVMDIIEHMSYSKSLDNPSAKKTLEQKIVEDADKLDAVGAIGIARAFSFGGNRNRLIYDPEYTAQTFTSSKEYKNAGGSTFHHFEEKLLLLKDLMNTKAGKAIAKDRDIYMREFLKQFLEEWDGNR